MPSSRYFAVAGPNDRARRSRAAASTARGSAGATFVAARTATALRFFAPSTAPSPPRPAWRPSWEIVAYRTPRSPAGPIAATRQPRPSRSRSARLGLGGRTGPTGPRRRLEPRRRRRRRAGPTARRSAPRTTIASWPVSLPAIAKWLEASASLSIPVSGDLATTANFALVVSGVPTSGEKHERQRRLGAERVDARPARAGACSQAPEPGAADVGAQHLARAAAGSPRSPSSTSTTRARPK